MTAKKDTIRTSVFIERKTAEELKKQAIERGQSLTYMINKALKTYLEEKNERA